MRCVQRVRRDIDEIDDCGATTLGGDLCPEHLALQVTELEKTVSGFRTLEAKLVELKSRPQQYRDDRARAEFFIDIVQGTDGRFFIAMQDKRGRGVRIGTIKIEADDWRWVDSEEPHLPGFIWDEIRSAINAFLNKRRDGSV